MSRNTVIVVVVLGAGALAMILAGALLAGGFLFFRVSTQRQEAMARHQQEASTACADALSQSAAAEPVPAAEAAAEADAAPLAVRRKEAMDRGVAYLLKEQAPDGSWGKGNVGVTALCTNGLLAGGKTIQDTEVRRAIDYLLKAQKPDGGIYDDVGLKTYATSIAVMALVRADPKAYAESLRKATAYLEKSQWGADESIDRADLKYGGFGYGKNNRPDMSNTQFCLDALRDAGVPKDSEVWARAVVFISRSQDRSESNDKAFAGRDDGGGIYSPVESKAEMIELPDGRKVMRTYGSMTYAVLKAFLFANLPRDDARVQAAVDWVRKHWTFEENPELGQQGLFYYYLTASRALKALGENQVRDARRRTHDWRAELSEAILRRQRASGAWYNDADRWYEGEMMAPVPTSYCLIALGECK